MRLTILASLAAASLLAGAVSASAEPIVPGSGHSASKSAPAKPKKSPGAYNFPVNGSAIRTYFDTNTDNDKLNATARGYERTEPTVPRARASRLVPGSDSF